MCCQRQVLASAAAGPYTQTAAEMHMQVVEFADAMYHRQRVASAAAEPCTQTAAETHVLVAALLALPLTQRA